MRRRDLVHGAGVGLAAMAFQASGVRRALGAPRASGGAKRAWQDGPHASLQPRWQKLDAEIRGWWPKDIGKADEAEVRADKAKTLLFLPLPFTTAAGTGSAYPDMYCWDTHFINQALIQHGHGAMALNNVRNQFSLIDRFGFVLNGNRTHYLTRSQTPLLWWSVASLLEHGQGKEFALEAYPRLEREYNGYWRATHHVTPTGLSRAFDLGDPGLTPELAAEAETGLDFTPLFGGDVRNCNPLIINAALIGYANTLASVAQTLNLRDKARHYALEAKKLSRLVDELCWDDETGFYFDYDFVQGKRQPYWSVLGYWMMWTGVPSRARAKRMVAHLDEFLAPGGLTVTKEEYPSPHDKWKRLQWNHPSAWPPLQIVAMQALDRYGFKAEAERVAANFLRNQLDTWDETGHLWERYDAVKGGADRKKERAEAYPFHGWSAASVVLLGNRLFA